MLIASISRNMTETLHWIDENFDLLVAAEGK